MADLAREDALDADVSAPGKRDIEQIADAQAEPPKRARTSESTAEPAAQPEEDARPSESAGDEAAPQEDEAAPQEDEVILLPSTPFSRGVALAEIGVKKSADEARADGNTQLADALQATIVTTAAQREAALVPRPPPENVSRVQQIGRRILLRGVASWFQGVEGLEDITLPLLTEEEVTEFNERIKQYRQCIQQYTRRIEQYRSSLN